MMVSIIFINSGLKTLNMEMILCVYFGQLQCTPDCCDTEREFCFMKKMCCLFWNMIVQLIFNIELKHTLHVKPKQTLPKWYNLDLHTDSAIYQVNNIKQHKSVLDLSSKHAHSFLSQHKLHVFVEFGEVCGLGISCLYSKSCCSP